MSEMFVETNTFYSVTAKFPYLASKKRKEGEELRRVAQFDWRVIERSVDTRFEAAGLTFTPLPVFDSSLKLFSFTLFRISLGCLMLKI